MIFSGDQLQWLTNLDNIELYRRKGMVDLGKADGNNKTDINIWKKKEKARKGKEEKMADMEGMNVVERTLALVLDKTVW